MFNKATKHHDEEEVTECNKMRNDQTNPLTDSQEFLYQILQCSITVLFWYAHINALRLND